MMRTAAALVHIFTALGVVCALFAALAIMDGAWEVLFVWLGVAFLIDGIDGVFARLVGVADRLPRFSGDRLDLVIDYVTYVFVPALALVAAGFLPGVIGLILAALILLSSLYHFSDLESKADDLSFVGFPAIWNVVAFYIFAFSLQPALAMAVVAICIIMTFVPMRWVHPFRVKALRSVTIIATLAWSLAAAGTVWWGFDATPLWAQLVLIVVLLYGLTLAFVAKRGQNEG